MFDMRPRIPKPAWRWLHALVALMLGLMAVIEATVSEGTPRRLMELGATLAMFGGMAAWVWRNRVALRGADQASSGGDRAASYLFF